MHAILNRPSRELQIVAAMFPLVAFIASARADIFQWEYINPANPTLGKKQSTTLAPGGAGVDGAPGADLSDRDLQMAYLTGKDLSPIYYLCGSLGCVGALQSNLSNTILIDAHLTNANFALATLTGADFGGAEVRGANFDTGYRGGALFGEVFGSGITLAQLYSTRSYQTHDLAGIGLGGNSVSGGNFAGQNLTNANFTYANWSGADFTAADTRGAYLFSIGLYVGLIPAGAITTNLIQINGHINSLDLSAGGRLVVRDYDGDPTRSIAPIPITIEQQLEMSPGGTLQMTLETDEWNSTISFAPDIPVTLGGTLELAFAEDVNLAGQVGRTFDLFDWFGVNPVGAFAVSSAYGWDVSRLYTTGEVIFLAVPEPSGVFLSILALAVILVTRRANSPARPVCQATASAFLILVFVPAGWAHIYQWEYINPGEPSQGKRQSAVLAPDGAGVDGVPGAIWDGRNLTMAYLSGADLTGVWGSYATLTNADLSQANLTNAGFESATLTGVDFTGAQIRGANFIKGDGGIGCPFSCDPNGTGIALPQLYSTASFQGHDLSGVSLNRNNLTGGNLTRQNLTNASFSIATLTEADFTDADVRGAYFTAGGAGLTSAQLYSTASYQAHDLTGIHLSNSDLSGWNFAGQNLANADLNAAILTDADFAGADVRGAYFTTGSAGLTAVQLYSTASYQAHDLTGIRLNNDDLSGWNFAGQYLANADFEGATLTDAEFSGADVRGVNFSRKYLTLSFPPGIPFPTTRGTGISPAQLYSTAGYQAGDSSGINFSYNNLAGANFAGQNLANVNFLGATLTDADFTDANVRGADFGRQEFCVFFTCGYTGGITLEQLYSTASYKERDLRGVVGLVLINVDTTNVILPNGHIDGLDFASGDLLVLRDYEGYYGFPISISVRQHLAMGPGGTLRMVFEADEWGSTIYFASGIPVTLGGTLELTFADDINLASQIGRTFDLFDWTGVTPAGTFAISSSYAWDLSQLYTTGEVTLTAIPERSAMTLTIVALLCLNFYRTRKIP